jgi:hypothetical protein
VTFEESEMRVLKYFLRSSVLALGGIILGSLESFAAFNSYKSTCCEIINPPDWATSFALNDLAEEMGREMGWSMRRVKVIFHPTLMSFSNASGLNFAASAFFSPSKQTIEFSPQKDYASFAPTFRHELSHVISNQKFKGGIPAWLEEGFANYLGSKRAVDYKWLKTQLIPNATSLSHPKVDSSGSKMHYQLSTATVEMIAAKCNLKDLLMLTTGAKLANYLETFCKIKDIDSAVKSWIVERK